MKFIYETIINKQVTSQYVTKQILIKWLIECNIQIIKTMFPPLAFDCVIFDQRTQIIKVICIENT